MRPLVACVPNFSEGRDQTTLDALGDAIRSVPGVFLLDVHADSWHHRSVFTFVGRPRAAAEAAFRAVRVAVERIDLTQHRGEHPRMGAADVVPFVPVRDVTMDDCVQLARELAQRVGRELKVPVYLYAKAANQRARESLPAIRKGGFEALREKIGHDPRLEPDAGPRHIHPTAGATAIGARRPLVAFNVYLETPDVAIAKEIASVIRASSGGLPAVQAMGFEVDGRAQVSMNLLDTDATPIETAFAAVAQEARRRDVAIERSEIVGLVPERALRGVTAAAMNLHDPESRALEARIRDAERSAGEEPR